MKPDHERLTLSGRPYSRHNIYREPNIQIRVEIRAAMYGSPPIIHF